MRPAHVRSGKSKSRATAIILSASLTYGIKTYFNFYTDWQKQFFVIEQLKNDPVVANANFVIMDDHSRDLDAIGRVYRFYEWNGLPVRALNDERRFAIHPWEISQYDRGE